MGVAVLFLIGALVVYTSLIRGELSVIGDEQAAVTAKQNSLSVQEQAVQKVQALIKQFEGVKNQDAIALAMPNGESTVDALREIQAVALQSGVVITAIDFKSSVPRAAAAQPLIKKLGTLEINLKVNGTYESARRFVQLLESGVRVANVKSFEFQPSPQAGISIGTLELVIDMYYQS